MVGSNILKFKKKVRLVPELSRKKNRTAGAQFRAHILADIQLSPWQNGDQKLGSFHFRKKSPRSSPTIPLSTQFLSAATVLKFPKSH